MESPDHQALPLDAPQVDRFEIVRELGRGGFGIVYLADDPKLGRPVALKVQRPETILSADLRRRFLREAKTAAILRIRISWRCTTRKSPASAAGSRASTSPARRSSNG